MENNKPKQEGQKEIIRVSVSEAAKLFGLSGQTIRRAVANQEIVYVVVAGRYKINFESLVKWSQMHTTVKNKLAQRGIGQFVDKWKIKNPLFSPNPKTLKKQLLKKEMDVKIETDKNIESAKQTDKNQIPT